MRNSLIEEVAQAAIEWNRARLKRIAAAKEIGGDTRLYQFNDRRNFEQARAAEALAKSKLRKACQKADPQCQVINVKSTFKQTTRIAA